MSVQARRRSAARGRLAPWGTTLLLLLTLTGCASIPNVRPFASSTAGLYRANGTEAASILAQYDASIDLADELLRDGGNGRRLDDAEVEIVGIIKERLENGKRSYNRSRRAFDRVLRQAVSYSEKLTELAAAGESGREAAQSLGDSVNGFAALAGAGTVLAGPALQAMEALADYVTRVQARRSLREAAAEAQGAVDTVAEVLAEIYRGEVSGEDDESLGGVQLLVTSLAADHDQLLLYRAGVSIVGYYREANGRRDKYYRRALLTLQLNDDGISGFCHDPETGAVDSECINETELSALRQVEDLLDRLQPEFEAYQAQRAEMTAWRALRRANGNRIVRAAGAWATEHERVVEALNDGSGASAFTLQAILAEIQSIQ